MGMSAHPATLPKRLYDAGKIEYNMFAMCFRRELGTSKRGVSAGSMTFGGFSNTLDTSPMVYAKNMARIGWFTVYVKNIYIRTNGGQSAKSSDKFRNTVKVAVDVNTLNSGKGVIVDSGTTGKPEKEIQPTRPTAYNPPRTRHLSQQEDCKTVF